MQPDLPDLAKRSAKIRLPRKEIARRASVDPNTVSRILNGANAHTLTHSSISDAIAAEEKALRDYLIGLHPLTGQAA